MRTKKFMTPQLAPDQTKSTAEYPATIASYMLIYTRNYFLANWTKMRKLQRQGNSKARDQIGSGDTSQVYRNFYKPIT